LTYETSTHSESPDYRHDEDRVRLQLNDTRVLFTFLPYDTRDPQIQKYLTSIGSNGVYYTRRSSKVQNS
jgi:hypothetical protein